MFKWRMRSAMLPLTGSNSLICMALGAAPAEFRGNGVLSGLVCGKNLPRSFDHTHGKGREARNLNAVAAIGRTGFNAA